MRKKLCVHYFHQLTKAASQMPIPETVEGHIFLAGDPLFQSPSKNFRLISGSYSPTIYLERLALISLSVMVIKIEFR